jgi:hypothetical protein
MEKGIRGYHCERGGEREGGEEEGSSRLQILSGSTERIFSEQSISIKAFGFEMKSRSTGCSCEIIIYKLTTDDTKRKKERRLVL